MPMDLLRLEHEVHERQGEQRLDLGQGPIIAYGQREHGIFESPGRQGAALSSIPAPPRLVNRAGAALVDEHGRASLT